ncbi:hypothetical protein P152DRAFT_7140 [Eremomyces bilateralis CBS 781.70]|uniref:Uncharacterized protein n=1 Tax=Eremomyces bilateralis CBS 781.70 TaxID=1392243 RepID=A0A6G1GG87_9PEZI|nr:uncharacterized protein P152DRAFT_7140 [Eremomyces bilateralis CBS 781.70]KAF1817063.1 hypothetical protein P152DRAFT_7140 [Eremomyces bilateralis CBS 781.70]
MSHCHLLHDPLISCLFHAPQSIPIPSFRLNRTRSSRWSLCICMGLAPMTGLMTGTVRVFRMWPAVPFALVTAMVTIGSGNLIHPLVYPLLSTVLSHVPLSLISSLVFATRYTAL